MGQQFHHRHDRPDGLGLSVALTTDCRGTRISSAFVGRPYQFPTKLRFAGLTRRPRGQSVGPQPAGELDEEPQVSASPALRVVKTNAETRG